MSASMPSQPDRRWRVRVSGSTDLTVELDPTALEVDAAAGQVRSAESADGAHTFEVVVDGWRFEVVAEPARRAELREMAARAARVHHRSAQLVLRAHIPGRVTSVWVAVGDEVEQGQRLLAIEAMKMENELRAPHAGRVEKLSVEPGARVEREAELIVLG